MVWQILQDNTRVIKQYSTPICKIWFVITFVFRLMIVTTVGSQVYGDEQGSFKCDTGQPGCQNVCYNRFSPISHLRFWAFQLLFLSMPKFILYGYVNFVRDQKLLLDKARERLNDQSHVRDMEAAKSSDSSRYHGYNDDHIEHQMRKLDAKEKKYAIREELIKKKFVVDEKGNLEEVTWTPMIRVLYILHLLAQIGVEIVFLYLNMLLQTNQTGVEGWHGFRVPERYNCLTSQHTSGVWGYSSNTACQQNDKIVCWVSRPWEKGIFVLYMAFWALMGIFLTFVELVYFLTHTAYKGYKRKKQRRRQKYALIRTTKLEDDSTSGHYNPYKTADFRERLNRNRNQNIHHRSKAGSQTNLQRQNRNDYQHNEDSNLYNNQNNAADTHAKSPDPLDTNFDGVPDVASAENLY